MKNNFVEEVIGEEDLKLLEEIASKHDMSLSAFGRFLGKIGSSRVEFHVRFSHEELEYVDKMKQLINIKARSNYCQFACKWFMENGLSGEFDLTKLKSSYGERSNRVCVSFTDVDTYKKVRKYSDKFKIPFSAIVRHCALTYTKN